MIKKFCDKCGTQISLDNSDSNYGERRLGVGCYGAMLFMGAKSWFPEDPEGTVYNTRKDLCPSCQYKLDKLVQDFMNESTSGES